HAASAVRRLPGPGDRHHAARPGDPEPEEAPERNLREAYRPAAQENRGRARARLFPDRRDGGGVGGRRQGHRQAARGGVQGRVTGRGTRTRASSLARIRYGMQFSLINKILIMPALTWFARG